MKIIHPAKVFAWVKYENKILEKELINPTWKTPVH